ncbi:hypothetical protein GCK72_021144 [Caenorhabditis remanei]|uniref:C2H2-type domain-containing protein n=1 Tax=Caenorhabditis remanei TaxID=31234 RepID=A0A6A5GIY5_CAERE|nr:hypothetical protein GCK72_021144 [Caenorhabditis remanei]KAF1754581.1 hypothetical protein GCK72_021144 [Caenorhabditis remanei]
MSSITGGVKKKKDDIIALSPFESTADEEDEERQQFEKSLTVVHCLPCIMNFSLIFMIIVCTFGFPSDGVPPKKKKTESPGGLQSSTTTSLSTSTPSPTNSAPLNTQPSTSIRCYFSEIRTGQLEKTERDSYTKVSTECGGNLVKWNTLVGTYQGRMHEAQNEMDLMAARGAAEYHDFDNPVTNEEVGNRIVCDHHRKELISDWNTWHLGQHIRQVKENHQLKCGLPSVVSPHSTVATPKVGHCFLSRNEAKRILEEHHVHVHVGTPLCKPHKDFVSVAECVSLLETSVSIDAPVSKRLISAVSKYQDESQSCSRDDLMEVDENDETDEDSLAYYPINKDEKQVCNSKFYEWLDSLGLKKIQPRKSFSQLNRRTKRRKAVAMKQVMTEALELLAPGSSEELYELMLDLDGNRWTTIRSRLFEELMESIVTEYSKVITRKERRSLLSLVTSILPYSTILKYFPGITRYEYTKSRQYSVLLNRTPYTSSIRQKYVKENVVAFIDFITSPLIRSDLPYGRRTLTKSDGSKLDVSNSLRNVRAIEIVEMYISMKTEANEESQLMSRSTLFKILEKCKATKREALECVDYFISDALDSFETISQHVKKMMTSGYIDAQTEKDFDKRLHEAKLYLQTDFKLHLKFESKISDHCIQFALSDSGNSKYASGCQEGKSSHDHKENFCERCQSVRDIFDDLKKTVEQLLKQAKEKSLRKTKDENIKCETELTVMLSDIETAETNVIELKKHQVRNKHSNNVRQKIVDALQKGDALLTLDWAQKIMPMQASESQSDFYGKSGISVHVTNVLSIDENGNFRQHNFVHIMKHEAQDAITVLLILEHVLGELKKSGILRVHLRSDNAGCYHSTKIITSLPTISKKTKVDIASFTFSEAQGGKGAADRAASEFKTKLRTWLASGKNAENPEQLFLGLTEGRIPKAMSSYLCTIDFSTVTEGKNEIKEVQNLYDFRFDNKNGKMIARKFGWIGEGTVHETKKFVAAKGTLNIEQSGGHVTPNLETFWKSAKCSKTCSEYDAEEQKKMEAVIPFGEKNVDVEEPIPKPVETVVFECPEEGCTAVFSKYGNLERHLSVGKHDIKPERETLLDFAMERYTENIEGLRESSIPSSLKEALVELPKGIEPYSNPEGWALPSKRVNKKYDKAVVKFVMEKFEELSEKKLKVYRKLIAAEIREQKKDGKLLFSSDT